MRHLRLFRRGCENVSSCCKAAGFGHGTCFSFATFNLVGASRPFLGFWTRSFLYLPYFQQHKLTSNALLYFSIEGFFVLIHFNLSTNFTALASFFKESNTVVVKDGSSAVLDLDVLEGAAVEE